VKREAELEIAPGIHSIPVDKGSFMGFFAPNVYLVVDKSDGALIDSGYGDEESIRARIDYIKSLESHLLYSAHSYPPRPYWWSTDNQGGNGGRDRSPLR